MNGTITQITDSQLHITLECPSACAHCESNKNCGFAENKEKEIVVDVADSEPFHTGDAVEVEIHESQGLLAVFIAYLLPAVLGLTLLVLTYHPWGELVSALATLGFFAIYVLILRMLRTRLQRRFNYQVRHRDEAMNQCI